MEPKESTQKGSDLPPSTLADRVCRFLDENKALDIVKIDLAGKSAFADAMIVANGTSGRFVRALADKLKEFFHKNGYTDIHIEGTTTCDWVLVDGHDVIVHLFRPEIRELYNLEKMWSLDFQHVSEA
ncbi:MAG: ribosome silencing factor [Alphaproteobacteria bacterium]|nr:ribosome silencing factor [Alphaproteobacteria bacterium]NCQ66941.1 ribosome silencing factor [Alphaproteobacteria bacterium]NCT07508.1 ribosome silencing factor [Alphaproteobacteria bacterium]